MVETKLQQYKYGSAASPAAKSPSKMTKRKCGLGFSAKCATLVKEQRARIYILRRCASMLLCWYIHGDE